MNFDDVIKVFMDLKNVLFEKKQAIIKKDMDKLAQIDEETAVLCQQIAKFKLEENQDLFSDDEKKQLKQLGEEIKNLTQNNEILIKHSLGVINGILSGILNIAQKEKNSYNSRGQGTNDESMDISSVIEEA
ncbi:MAG: hypothetical protein IJD57_08085 [Candidatus Gastranaerophilales bacterium]|nr:hypothetical protein [Candidatus Gastranaerophilales bacterium]